MHVQISQRDERGGDGKANHSRTQKGGTHPSAGFVKQFRLSEVETVE